VNDILSMITSQLSGNNLSTISRQIGADDTQTRSAISATLPLLVSALANNAAKPDQAQQLHNALEKDHDGGLLDNLGGFLRNPALANGGAILGHIFGRKRQTVEAGVAGGTGLNAGQAAQLLQILAPIVMAALGRMQRSGGMDAGSLAGMLGQQKTAAAAESGGLLGSLNSMLDSDNDGSAMDDIAGIAGSLFGKK
jgi:hypothetical protein